MTVKHVLAGCVAALSSVVSAQIDLSAPNFTQIPSIFDRVNTPFTFTDCAAPKEMQTCWEAQNYTAEYYDNECYGLQNRIECALTNCWNRVYSCDYQQLLLAYNETCPDQGPSAKSPTLELPFYPPPADAAGECSCNLKTVSESLESPFDGFQTCLQKVHQEDGVTDDENDQYTYFGKPAPQCDCCVYGAVAAALWDTCPSQNPGFIALDTVKQLYIDTAIIAGNITLAECPSILSNKSFSCSDYGFANYGKNASDYAKPTPLHSATGTWSEVNGILTSPVSGPTYTWTAWNTTVTITAASVEAVATRSASATGKGSGAATSGSGTRSSGSGTATGGTAKSTGAAPTVMALQHPAAAMVGLGGFALALL
ncbi:hypothetical protein QM012_003429 [Aureobasidium pullulans]|uniref:Secreted protein n=1 Tax=Aureobasidium pullulans TaxID=5580 RepID=A0ABR0T8J9_AURPU